MRFNKPEDLPKAGKLLALDVGSKTIGIATSDATQTIASAGQTIARTKWAENKKALNQLIQAENVVGIVVGLPLEMSGQAGKSAQSVSDFAALVKEEFNLPVVMWDERLSTASAEAVLFQQRQGRQTRASRKDIKKQVDSVAATLILQGVLEMRR